MNLFPAVLPVAPRHPQPEPFFAAAGWDVRPIARTDAALLMALCDQQRAECGGSRAVYGTPRATVLELMEALFEPPLRAWAWIAWHDDAAVGYAAATAGFSLLERAYYLRLEALYVDAAWRGREVEARLLEAVQATAIDMGCVNLQWQDGAHLSHIALGGAHTALRAQAHVLSLHDESSQ